jgi:hypothetical protein
MTTPPERLTSAAPLKVHLQLIPGKHKETDKLAMDITATQANAITMNQYLPVRSPLARPAVTYIPGAVEPFCSGSAEYTLSVIGILCIVYGIVAK